MQVRAVLFTATLVTLLTTIDISPTQADITIAVVGPMSVTTMTGQYAAFGEALTRGAAMAVKDVNAQGGVNGQQIVLQIADDACDPEQAVAVAAQLVAQGVVFIDGHYCSGSSIPASRVYHDAGVLMITPSSTNPRLTEQGFANVFRVNGRDDLQGAAAADYVVDNGLGSRVAVVHDQTTFGKSIADEFRKQLNKRSVREVIYEAISQGDQDFDALITRMREADVGLVYFGGYHIEAGLLARQIREHGLGARMMVTSAVITREYWDLAGPGGEGTLMTFAPDPRELPSAAEVVRRFEAEGYSPEGHTLYAYAAVQVFAEAARKAGSTGLDALIKALHEDTYETVLGPLTFDGKGDVIGYTYCIYEWHAGIYKKTFCPRPHAG
jgi:branched-chain amino acid transport system substrate-binding protein